MSHLVKSQKLRWMCRLSLVGMLLVFLSLSSNAQTATTSVRGDVTDASVRNLASAL